MPSKNPVRHLCAIKVSGRRRCNRKAVRTRIIGDGPKWVCDTHIAELDAATENVLRRAGRGR